MNDDVLKKEYIVLNNKLLLIKDNLLQLQDIYDDMIVNINDNLLVDDKLVCVDSFDEIKLDLQYVTSELIDIVIPSVNNKL